MTKRDYLGYIWVLLSPTLAFLIVLCDDNVVQDMIDKPWTKLFAGFCAEMFWLGFTALFMIADKLLAKNEKKRGNEDGREIE